MDLEKSSNTCSGYIEGKRTHAQLTLCAHTGSSNGGGGWGAGPREWRASSTDLPPLRRAITRNHAHAVLVQHQRSVGPPPPTREPASPPCTQRHRRAYGGIGRPLAVACGMHHASAPRRLWRRRRSGLGVPWQLRRSCCPGP